ncbi:dipeptidase [uncultured Eudoraea sp.]|uniref:dipeptidase n=1 Tax=uncultured Eudoraea sp. TaxID=1035614 RepID=UPI0026369697|nr:dipeptidase [uncultured Eudoraea sp.]
MRHLIGFIGLITLFGCGESNKTSRPNMESKARQIHENVITIDTHDDINVKNFTDSINYTQNLDTQLNLPKMKAGGLDVAWLIVFTGQDSLNQEGYDKAKLNAMAKFNAIHRLCDSLAPNEIKLARTSKEVRSIIESGKKVAMIGVENAFPIGEDLTQFEAYHKLGARYISLAHNGHSQFCDSHTGEKDNIWLNNGLSNLGKKAVYEMNRLGIMVDISHVSRESMLQILSLSKAPVIASHSSARALCDHSRNLDDEQLKLLKENGGVVQTVALDAYLNTSKHENREAYMKKIYEDIADSLGIMWVERSQLGKLSEKQIEDYLENSGKVYELAKEMVADRNDVPPEVDVADFVDHIDYMVDLIGIDHVGISSDFDGGGGIKGWADASETYNVTLELVQRGYSESEIDKLWGGNLLRVLDEVQAYAASLGD